ncbi:hypothetical protein HW130_01580 [Streptomyces sp. PKU-EA00015]|uniref:hypothetical protein n=1 Tax=Streptomyces sp. PKU-EA00015 TaxID=2748326 RepID=UPI0015A45982|nr:hypothetical protein [Streptomyces sp. PKU-EA00015]NWF24961.1 hypothetical protein [Streptomyces sp. PKU-EA00015]
MTDPCWFHLPPGFVELDLDDVDGLTQRLCDDMNALGMGGTALQAPHAASTALRMFGDLREHGTMFVAVGLHADTDAGVSTSVLSLSEVMVGTCTSTLAAAHCGLRLAGTDFGTIRRRELVELPCSTGSALVTCTLPPPPDMGGDPAAMATGSQEVFQARLCVPRPSGPRVIVIDLTTTAVEFCDEYTEILMGVGRTVTFEPSAPPTVSPPPRSTLSDLAL